mgnify:CR=1 FL=1
MEIFIITICNKKENYIENLNDKYIRLIEKSYKINFININFNKKKSNNDLYDDEYKKAISIVKPNSTVIALDENGENFDSREFSKEMTLWLERYSYLYFIIGGPNGLSEFVKNKADKIISLSNLTFPHQLAKVILSEQLYRSICIMNNHPYHRT